MSDSAFPLQKAIYDALTGDSDLMALITGVFDNVPQGQAFPYVTIGDDILTDWASHTFDGASIEASIHAWARANGRKGCKSIQAEIRRILHDVSLSVSGFKTVSLRQTFENTMLDPDNETYHGVQRFSVLLSEA
jgi:hypothetical protein